jgi:hypothetical protein
MTTTLPRSIEAKLPLIIQQDNLHHVIRSFTQWCHLMWSELSDVQARANQLQQDLVEMLSQVDELERIHKDGALSLSEVHCYLEVKQTARETKKQQ